MAVAATTGSSSSSASADASFLTHSLCPESPFFLVSPPPAGFLPFSVMAMAATTGSSSSSASAAADKAAPALPPLTVKLDPTKYPLWLAQIIPLLNSNGLMPFVDGTMCPPAFLLDADGKPTNTTNPDYDHWIQMDQFVLSLINGSLSHFVVATLEGSISARATWVALEALLLGAEQQVPTPMVSVSDHSTAAAAASPGCGFDHVASGGETSGGGGGGGGGGGDGGGTTGEGVSGKKGLPGVKFFTEEELVGYLTNKIEGKDSEFRDWIPVIDHVCKREPRDLPAVFFSKLDYKNSKRDRCNRTTDEGFYKSTGNVREIKAEQSQAVIGNKRILPFCEGRGPQAKKTKYVMHEYSLTKTELAKMGVGPDPNQQEEFVLCCLKNKSANSKKQKDGSICGNELAEPAIGGKIASNSEDDQAAATGMIQGPGEHLTDKDVLLGTENRNECAESVSPNGFSPAIGGDVASNSQDDQAAANHMIPKAEEHLLGSGNHNDGEPGGFDFDIMQELCAQLGLDSPSPPPEQPRSHQLPQLGNVPGTGDYLPSNSDNQAAAIHPMITDEEELLAFKELERVLLGSGNPDNGEPGSCVSSDMRQESCAQPGKDLDSPVPPPGPPELGNAPDVYTDECSSWPSQIEDNDSSLPNKNNIPNNYDSKPVSNTASNFENQTTYERSSEVYCQSEENLQSFYRSLELEDYAFSSPISYLDLGDILHTNNYIGCNESQPAALFPQSS